MNANLIVVFPSFGVSIQDMGRTGCQALGVPPSGALDPVMLQIANSLVGNDGGVGALEMRFGAPVFEVIGGAVRVAVAGEGATLQLLSANKHIPGYRSTTVASGQSFRVNLRSGAACYLAVAGGFDVTPVLGSVSTLSVASLGGFHGRPLTTGDILPVRETAMDEGERILRSPKLATPDRLRVILGPQDDYFGPDGITQFLSQAFTISPRSDRMGIRLEGQALRHVKRADIISDGTAPGSIQVPGSGHPIILLADRGTTGGYAKIATVITADLPLLGRLAPGATVRFRAVSHAEAVAALRALNAWLDETRCAIRPYRDTCDGLAAVLAEENIISGVTDGSLRYDE